MSTDSDGNSPQYMAGDTVTFLPTGETCTVVRQILHHDCGETFWGNVVLTDASGSELVANCWQCEPAKAKVKQ